MSEHPQPRWEPEHPIGYLGRPIDFSPTHPGRQWTMTTPVDPDGAYPEPTVKTPDEPVADGVDEETVERLSTQFWAYYSKAALDLGLASNSLAWGELAETDQTAIREAVKRTYLDIMRGQG